MGPTSTKSGMESYKMRNTAINKTATKEGVEFTLDPTGHYSERMGEGKALRGCLEATGILPNFMLGSGNLSENMVDNYDFFMGWNSDPQGDFEPDTECFTYPGDPKQYPIMKAHKVTEPDGEWIYIYPHAVVVVVRDGKLIKRTRMD